MIQTNSMIAEQKLISKGLRNICIGVLITLYIIEVSCIPVKKDSSTSSLPGVVDIQAVQPDLKDSTFRQILKAENDQNLGILYSYFNSPSAMVRYASATALGSVRDSAAADTLASLLKDPNISVASAAAYSLGLIGAAKSQISLISAFRQYDTSGITSPVNGAILESIGRLGTPDFLHAMATVETYKPSDTLLLLGQIRGIYRYMLRGMTDAAGTATAVRYLTDVSIPMEVRLMAAHYLARGKNLDLAAYNDALINLFNKETNKDITLPLILALGKTKSDNARRIIVNIIDKNEDGKLVSNALRALSNFEYSLTKPMVLKALHSNNLSIASAAVSYLNDFGREVDANDYRNIARENLPWQVKIPLLGVANKNYSYAYGITKGNVNGELKSIVNRTDNLAEKIACIRSLGTDPKNIKFLLEMGQESGIPAIHAAVMEACLEAIKSKYFNSAFGNSGDEIKKQVFDFINSKLTGGDEAALEIIESAAKDDNLKKSIDISSIDQIKTALASKPYAQYMLTRTLNSLRGASTPLTPLTNYQKLSTDDFKMDGVSNYAEIITDKGNIKLHLLKNIAPATVLNFVRLGKSEFFNGKNFHRVVPNFVIQGGCPRGDGYGSMDYTIRSETPQIYYNKGGMVGMASSGNHTESCQFFITHSATPHLDGNYTIFAEVVSGMEVVDAIQIGDKIQRINFTE